MTSIYFLASAWGTFAFSVDDDEHPTRGSANRQKTIKTDITTVTSIRTADSGNCRTTERKISPKLLWVDKALPQQSPDMNDWTAVNFHHYNILECQLCNSEVVVGNSAETDGGATGGERLNDYGTTVLLPRPMNSLY